MYKLSYAVYTLDFCALGQFSLAEVFQESS